MANPLPILVIAAGALAGTAAVLSRKRSTVEARLADYWARVWNPDPPDVIVREWVMSATPGLTEAEVAELVPAGFIFTKADALLPSARLVRGLDLHRVVGGRVSPHWGADFSAPEGTPVYAAKTGVVSRIEPVCGYGNIVGLSHLSRNNESTLYAHLQYVDVGLGEIVEGGSQIGRVGATTHCPSGGAPDWEPGRAASMPPHLHFEVHRFRVPQLGRNITRRNPLDWLTAEAIPYSAA